MKILVCLRQILGESGCRFIERLLTVVQTLRLRKGLVVPWLTETLIAYRTAQTARKLPLAQ